MLFSTEMQCFLCQAQVWPQNKRSIGPLPKQIEPMSQLYDKYIKKNYKNTTKIKF